VRDVFINARFLTQPVSGVQRYAREVLGALDRVLSAENARPITAFFPAGSPIDLPDWTHIKLRALPGGGGHLWEQGALWHASKRGVLVSLCNSGPLLHDRQILTLHDANIYAIPHAFSARYRRFHKTLRPRLARRAGQLLTVSRFSAAELGRHCAVPAAGFKVVANGADHILRQVADTSVLSAHGLRRGGYLLTVGNQSPNKNIARLVAAHARDPALPVLAIVGGAAPGLVSHDIAQAGNVRNLGRVTDAQLCALYEGAFGFVWPSLYEGFGIPPLEAMILGTLVLSAQSSAMPEVLGDAALYFDPCDVDDIARALSEFCGLSVDSRDKLRRAGIAQAGLYTWDQSARALLSVIREATRTQNEPIIAQNRAIKSRSSAPY
jgi:glycosyltransferase involved in cell wall biosynthesis